MLSIEQAVSPWVNIPLDIGEPAGRPVGKRRQRVTATL